MEVFKAELQKNGYKFLTQSDTEVLLKGYDFWKSEILNKIEGMFAFAIYNYKTSELFCARDRIGKKPFVYSETPFGFVFASELPAIIKNKDFYNLNLNLITLQYSHYLVRILDKSQSLIVFIKI